MSLFIFEKRERERLNEDFNPLTREQLKCFTAADCTDVGNVSVAILIDSSSLGGRSVCLLFWPLIYTLG